MRKSFANTVKNAMALNDKIYFLTGDLGYHALEALRDAAGKRFINAGVAEQSMTSIAAGIAYNKNFVFTYSIAPFAVYRCYEQIKIDICIHNLPVCIVGNGGGYGYGIMGATHHALEDIACLSPLPNMTCWIPAFEEDVKFCLDKIIELNKPAYLRLGLGKKSPQKTNLSFTNCIKTSDQQEITIITLGPIVNNVLEALNGINNVSLFTVLTIPFLENPSTLIESISITKKVMVIEEHLQRGGLGEYLLMYLKNTGLDIAEFQSIAAKGYPSKTIGSQGFHQKESGLDPESMRNAIINFLEPDE